MGFGILIFGQNGAGKSTLAHALARETGWFEMDVEDYYFPSQRASRAAALDGRIQELPQSADVPFSAPQSKETVTEAIRADVLTHPHFILSGVTVHHFPADILASIVLAVRLEVPLDCRLTRIHDREKYRFGDRVAEGGDMYTQQNAFRAMVKHRADTVIDEREAELHCPVLPLSGETPVTENVAVLCDWLTKNGIRPRFYSE